MCVHSLESSGNGKVRCSSEILISLHFGIGTDRLPHYMLRELDAVRWRLQKLCN